MRVKLLGYLGYVAGKEVIEVGNVKDIKDVLDRLSTLKGMDVLLYNGDMLWEGILLILNGKVVGKDTEVVKEDDELVITLPTAGG
ncbi:MAG: MoaD/ThiS family protein [Aquificaceae bacterium]